MSGRRVLALYAVLITGFMGVVCRLFWLCSNAEYAERAVRQSRVVLALPARRGNFYDCEGRLLTGQEERWVALCVPGQGSYARLYEVASTAGQAKLYQKRNAAVPFLLEVGQDMTEAGVACWPTRRRYAAQPLAAGLLGYLDGEGHGVAGLEAALDGVLAGTGRHDTLVCALNAQGALRAGTVPELVRADSGALGVKLTLSRPIQQAAERVAAQTMTSGCILVLDTATARVRASVSVPSFDPENVSASLDAAGSPLVDRAFQAYAVGSVFKPVVAAAALEAGETSLALSCPGYCLVEGQAFRCAGGVPHGEVTLAGALQKSCNGYFIRLGQALGTERVLKMAQRLGFGHAQWLADGLETAAGQLPQSETLQAEGAFANFCFGQGELLATPLQVAGMMNAIAAGGIYREPLLLDSVVDETSGEVLEPLAHRRARRVLSEQTAHALQELLAGVVTDGTGREAQPAQGWAAGKTGTAQTGQFAGGEELKNYWFAGFWQAEGARYTIIILQDAQNAPCCSSAEIFARVCESLSFLQR